MSIRAVARRAGVSSATVSRVLNGLPLVKEETANRVRSTLLEMNFIPNPSATTLKYGRSKTFGLVIPDICNPFYAEFLGAFEDVLLEVDHEVLVTSVQDESKLIRSVRRMLMRQVDGAVLMASEFDTQAIEPLLLRRTPLVTVDRRAVQQGCSDVSIDFEIGFLQAVRHLHDLGHKHLAFIGGSDGLRTSKVRLSAFCQALQAVGLPYFPSLVRSGDYRIPGGVEAALSLMQERPRPTALLTANDLTAFGAVRGLHMLGLQVPRDLSVIGLDDVLLDEIIFPPLTSIRIPRKRLALACLQALTDTKESVERPGREYSVPTSLAVRESTAKASSFPAQKRPRTMRTAMR